MGKFLMLLGLLLFTIGLLFTLFPHLFNWFGKLPGDILIQDQHTTIFIPFTSMILISIILTLLFNFMK